MFNAEEKKKTLKMKGANFHSPAADDLRHCEVVQFSRSPVVTRRNLEQFTFGRAVLSVSKLRRFAPRTVSPLGHSFERKIDTHAMITGAMYLYRY